MDNEKTTRFPMLPKLIKESAVNADLSGKWIPETKDFLRALVKSIAAGGDIQEIGQIDSIPDVWARPLLFQMALYDSQREGTMEFVAKLHARVVGEWRCLLAMLALKEIRHLDLEATFVDVGADKSSLAEVLRELAPKDSLSTDTNWSELYILKYRGVPLAMTSPTTLVASAADYMTALEQAGIFIEQPWYNGDVSQRTLCDPIPYLTAEELAQLYTWLSKLRESLGRDENPLLLGLLEALDLYCKDIENQVRGDLRPDFEIVDADLGMNKGIFRKLNWCIMGEAATAASSAVKLQTSGRDTTREVILVSPTMVREFAEQQGISASRLVVWPGVSANDITDEMLCGEKNRLGSHSLGDTEYRRPEDFFLDRLTVLSVLGGFVGTQKIRGTKVLDSDGIGVILPIKRELLEYFTPEEIASRMSFEAKRDCVILSFSFPLSGAKDGEATYKYKKVYLKNEKDTQIVRTVPVVEIWPNVRREGWNRYYLYYENSEAQGNDSERTEEKKILHVEPWSYGKNLAAEVSQNGLVNQYTARMNGFPEALLCTVNVGSGNMWTPIEGGILLLKAPEMVATNYDAAWQIGIDFGTSNTMIYYREGRRSPAPLNMNAHLFHVTNSNALLTQTFINFIPSLFSCTDGSFQSIFHVLNFQDRGQTIRPLQDGHVLLLEDNEEHRAVFVSQSNRIDANLKWKDDALGRRKVGAYIKQVCLMCAAEAMACGVTKLTWNFSYPTAFSIEQKMAFQATCDEAVKETYQDTCFSLPEQEAFLSWSESKASAYYFNKMGTGDTNFAEGAICLDIGAGTTDISVVSGQPGKIVYHTSIQFAGRYLFKPIYDRIEAFSKGSVDFLDGELTPEERNAIIDACMRNHSQEYLDELKNITGKAENKEALQTAQLGVAGLFWYLGMVLKSLHTMGVYQENRVPDVYVGGNGSRIFHWITGGQFNSDSPALEILRTVMVKSSALYDDGFRITLSNAPKIEVASGMIAERPYNDAEFFNEKQQREALFGAGSDAVMDTAVLAGESYAMGDTEQDAHTFLSANDIVAGIRVTSLAELATFLDVFDHSGQTWSEPYGFGDREFTEIERRVNSYYVAQKGADPKKVFVEPVYIQALKKTMEALSNA